VVARDPRDDAGAAVHADERGGDDPHQRADGDDVGGPVPADVVEGGGERRVGHLCQGGARYHQGQGGAHERVDHGHDQHGAQDADGQVLARVAGLLCVLVVAVGVGVFREGVVGYQ